MASRYWVGGTATWDATAGTKWALTSGGAGGQSVPTSTDDVFFDANSGANTVSIPGSVNCQNLNCTGFTGTLAWTTSSSTINTYGSVTFSTGMSTTVAAVQSAIQFFGTTAATVTTNGKTQPSWSFLSANTWTVNDNVTFASGCCFTATGGTPATCRVIGLAGSLRQMNFTGAPYGVAVGLYAGSTTSGYIENFALTFSSMSGANRLIVAASSTTRQIQSCSVSVTGTDATTNDTLYVGDTSSAALTSLSYTATRLVANGKLSLVRSQSGVPIPVGSLTVAPTSGELMFSADVACSTGITITGSNRSTGRVIWFERYANNPVNGTPTISLTNVSFARLTPTGTAWTGTSLENLGGNSNITFTTATTRTASASGNWTSEATWGSNPMPLAQDTVVIGASVAVTANRLGGWGAGSSLTLNSGASISGMFFKYGRSNVTIPSTAGGLTNMSLAFAEALADTSGSYTVSVSKDIAGLYFGFHPSAYDPGNPGSPKLTVTVSTDAASRSLGYVFFGDSPTRFDISVSTAFTVERIIGQSSLGANAVFSSTQNCTIAGVNSAYGYVLYSASTGAYISLANVTLSGTGQKTINNAGGGIQPLSSLSVSGAGGLVFTGSSMTLGAVSRTATAAETWTFASNRTYTVTGWTAKGQSGALLGLTSSSALAATLAYSGTGYLDLDYLSVSYLTASPSNTWFAGHNSTEGLGNTGWTFSTYAASQAKGLFFGSNF